MENAVAMDNPIFSVHDDHAGLGLAAQKNF